MNKITFSIFQKTDSLSLLRLFDHEDRLAGERELDDGAVAALAKLAEAYYRRDTPQLNAIGSQLYGWLDGPTERWLARVGDGADGTAVFVDVAERLRHLPWELLSREGVYLCRNVHRPFTPIRLAAKTKRDHQRENRPLRILFMACSAEDIKPLLHYEFEEKRILDAAGRYDIELVVEERGSSAGLAERLTEYGDDGGKGYFDIFHLTGHADVNQEKTPIFWMENDLGYGVAVTADELARSFAGNWPRLVFLSGCKTAQSSELGLLPSFCEALVAAGAPAVLGWALPVRDDHATEAAAELYRHLAAGKRIDEAVARARLHLLEKDIPDWHLLRLYADRTPPAEVVTPPNARGRERIVLREASAEFLDENARSEVCPRGEFVGRRRPLQRCLRSLTSRQRDQHYAEGVLLSGMGGLGKSSLAARLCERLPGYRRLVWYAAIDELAFTTKLGDKLADIEVNLLLNQPLSLRQRLRRLLETEAFNQPALFVFDDFEQNLDPDGGGGYRVKPEAMEVLTALLAAIRETASASRVIVTSRYRFPLPGPARLYEEGLESLSDAELSKKLRQLDEKFDLRLVVADLKLLAERLGAGNPRLLERLYRVVADAETDHAVIFAALAQTADEFREEILLRELLGRQSPECRRLVALSAVCRLPVDRAAIEAIAGEAPIDPHLERAVALGLVEAGVETDPGTGRHSPRYFVSDLLLPLLDGTLSQDEESDAQQRAARHLHRQWWVQAESRNIEQALEVHRLSLVAREKEIAIEICDLISTAWHNRAQYREAVALCLATLTLGDDYRILLHLARSEKVLGIGLPREHYEQALAECPEADVASRSSILFNYAELVAQQGDVKRALELWQQSLALKEQIGDVKGKAATLHQMAGVIAQQGDVKRALELWQQSLAVDEQIGDVKGKAATLHNMAGVIAQQGDVKRALELWQQSLAVDEQIGDVKGKAATLHNMAGVIAQQGDVKRALELWQQSLALLEQIGDVQGKAATLSMMAGVIAQQGDVKRALELWQQSLALKEQIGDVKGKAATLHQMAGVIAQQGDVKRALELWQQSLAVDEQIGDVKGKAATLHNMAGVIAQQGDVKRALELWQQSLALKEQIGDVKGKAATLHNMAGVIAQQGDVKRALELWQQSLALKEQIGDVKGKAATLHQMAGVIAQQGDVKRALELWQQSLALKEQIGDVQGKAATLANMAWLAGKQGDAEESRRLNLEAARSLSDVRSWLDLVIVLSNLGSLGGEEDAVFLAQAMWLALRVEVPAEDSLSLVAAMVEKLGVEHELAPQLAMAAILLVQMRGENHPQQQEMLLGASGMLMACAEARGVEPDKFEGWMEREGLNDPNRFMPELIAGLEAMVGAGEWLFDRRDFG